MAVDINITGQYLQNGVPIGGGSSAIQTDFITSSSVWTKPAGAKKIEVHIVSGAGGGGAGYRGPALSNKYGGGGGASGSVCIAEFLADMIPSTVNVWIGAGGIGAVGQTVDNTNGANGGNGLGSYFGGTGSASTAIVATAASSPSGQGGRSTSNGTGSSTNSSIRGVPLQSNQYASSSRNSGTFGGTVIDYSAILNGGSWGGGITAAGASSSSSGSRVVAFTNSSQIIFPSNFSFGNGNNGNFKLSTTDTIPNYYYSEGGGGGGSGTDAGGVAGNGGNGALGSGGGGGGASVNGVVSGAGGNGGNGFCLIITYF